MSGYARHDEYVKWSDKKLINKSNQLQELLTPKGKYSKELAELLEIERELTLREEQ